MPLATHSKCSFLAVSLVLLLAVSSASAVDWVESGDAGELPDGYQTTIGVGLLNTISGTIDDTSDRDLFCVRINDPSQFVASLLCASPAGLDLWMFSTTGLGISHDDGCVASATQLTGAFKPGPGSYLIGISSEGAVARNNTSQAIWAAGPLAGERAPDGPGAPGPIVSWALQSGVPLFTPYTLQLAGCVPCDAVVKTKASSWGALKLHHR